MNNIIECKDLTLAYDGATVLSGLSFEVKRGEILLVSGENGSGKSTLIKALLGLLKPIKGEVGYFGSKRRGSIGYLPQQSAAQRDFPATVNEVVRSGFVGRLRYGMFCPKEKERAERAMKLTGVDKLAGRSFSELSGGQAQRTLLARALVAADELLILDEPTNGLDPAAARDMYTIIESLRDSGMTVIMVSHDLETSAMLADRVLHLCNDGAFCCCACEYAEKLSEAHGNHRHIHMDHNHRRDEDSEDGTAHSRGDEKNVSDSANGVAECDGDVKAHGEDGER